MRYQLLRPRGPGEERREVCADPAGPCADATPELPLCLSCPSPSSGGEREDPRVPRPFHPPPAPSCQGPGNNSNRICGPGTGLPPLTFWPTSAEVAMATPTIKKLTL